MDYFHFLYGFGLTLLAIVSVALRRTKDPRLLWTWLALFGIIHGLDEWVVLLSIGIGAGPLSDAIRGFTTILAFACLVEFGCAGIAHGRNRSVGRAALVCLLAVAALGSLTGMHALTEEASCVLRVAGTVLSALALLLSARADTGNARRSLAAAGVAMALYAGIIAWGSPSIPVELISAFLIISAAAALSCYCQCGSCAGEDPAVLGTRRRTAVWTTLTVALILTFGLVVTNLVSSQADRSFRSNLLSRTILAGSSINPTYIQALTGTAADVDSEGFRLLRKQLQCIHLANDDYRYVCLMGLWRGKTIFLVDAEPETSSTYSPPGTVYKSASDNLIHSFSAPLPFVEGPCSDEYGSWVSGVAPVLDPFTGRIIAVLDMELTESTLMRNPDAASVVLRVLKSMGVRISIDDFGTGYSSLSYLKGLPIDALKIDQSFVQDITTKTEDAAVARGVVAMAHSLNLSVIAEGVETLDQLKILSAIGCDEVQGYFIGKPMAADDLRQMLLDEDGNRRALFAA